MSRSRSALSTAVRFAVTLATLTVVAATTAEARYRHHHYYRSSHVAIEPNFAPPAPFAPEPLRDALFGGQFGLGASSYTNSFYGPRNYYGPVGPSGFIAAPGYGYGGY